VLPGLYVGNYRDSKDQQQLDRHFISHILSVHDSPKRLLAVIYYSVLFGLSELFLYIFFFVFFKEKHYLCVMAADTPDQNLSQYFAICNDFIHAARLKEGNVLIHW
jgi:atypical dual specificity phosphatase